MSNASHGRTYAGFNERYSGKPSKPGNKQDAYAEPPVSSPGPVEPRLFLQDPDVTLYHGDAVEVLKTLPAESVHMCVTSPPFYGLRDYGTGRWEGGDPGCDHKASNFDRGNAGSRASAATQDRATPFRDVCGKCGAQRVDQQIGLEETPEQWVDSLVAVFREVRRVLRDDGTLWLEVGDSYATGTSAQRNPTSTAKHGNWENDAAFARVDAPGCKPKDLIGAPWMLAFALRADGWYLRSDIVWARPNPMPESVTDRPTKSHSYVFLLSKLPRYFFDQEAVREPQTTAAVGMEGRQPPPNKGRVVPRSDGQDRAAHLANDGWIPNGYNNPAGRNVRSVWNIATQPYPEAHFATFPEELARRCILAGTSERGCCPECGAPWIRQTETSYELPADGKRHRRRTLVENERGECRGARPTSAYVDSRGEVLSKRTETLGWRPSCDCGHRRAPNPALRDRLRVASTGRGASVAACVVLDPFVGSGTVPYVARKHGRHSIGIDLSESYLELAARRLQQLSLFA